MVKHVDFASVFNLGPSKRNLRIYLEGRSWQKVKFINPSKLVGIPMISSRDEYENIQTEYFVNFIWYGLMNMEITFLFYYWLYGLLRASVGS